jgi:hypothetical protein
MGGESPKKLHAVINKMVDYLKLEKSALQE